LEKEVLLQLLLRFASEYATRKENAEIKSRRN
jgi:hypothetical protein